jgi:hypothetical protein
VAEAASADLVAVVLVAVVLGVIGSEKNKK